MMMMLFFSRKKYYARIYLFLFVIFYFTYRHFLYKGGEESPPLYYTGEKKKLQKPLYGGGSYRYPFGTFNTDLERSRQFRPSNVVFKFVLEFGRMLCTIEKKSFYTAFC